jgi:extracellular factor (EF) 3-hydroxypalmitic acid methyl ester biosynthesis protein
VTGGELEVFRRQQLSTWTHSVPLVRAMPGFSTFQEDPFTSHAYRRPRGYPGDAGLLDFIYRSDAPAPGHTSEAGLAVFRAMRVAAAPTAVRNRQTIVARAVDTAALDLGRPLRIASLGCGHLAEAEGMAAFQTGAIERLWAIDQDPQSIAEVHRRFPRAAVSGVVASVKDFLRGRPAEIRDLDVFYAAGLFDYLPERAAKCLARRMFERVRPGGRLLIANFLIGIPDRAYMEAVMDWWLLYRTEDEVAALDADIDPAQVGAKHVFVEPERNIAFLELHRK